jgi:hypothetical protein
VCIDKNNKTTILATYGDDPTPMVFHTFPLEAHSVSAVELVDLDGGGRMAAVAGLGMALAEHNLFAFDPQGNELWLLDTSSAIRWPDCGPAAKWSCSHLAAYNLDSEPGDEVIVLATDRFEYPTRISIIDPREKGEIRSTFWHWGTIADICVQPDFFEAGRPAIIAWGLNNKLDGFHEPRPDDPEKLTEWQRVWVVLILDPRNMEGLGPPHTNRVDIPPATPHAYAFLDLPTLAAEVLVLDEEAGGAGQKPDQVPSITVVDSARYPVDDPTGPWFKVHIPWPGQGGAILTVDRNLKCGEVIIGDGGDISNTVEYWREHWRPIIQNGKYLKERAPRLQDARNR